MTHCGAPVRATTSTAGVAPRSMKVGNPVHRGAAMPRVYHTLQSAKLRLPHAARCVRPARKVKPSQLFCRQRLAAKRDTAVPRSRAATRFRHLRRSAGQDAARVDQPWWGGCSWATHNNAREPGYQHWSRVHSRSQGRSPGRIAPDPPGWIGGRNDGLAGCTTTPPPL
jgi:hypothetical protein